jgi:ribosomal protein L17
MGKSHVTEIIRNHTTYMHQHLGMIYIVERTATRKGGLFRNTWSVMPATVDPAKPPAENVDRLITFAREVPLEIRKAARAHFDQRDKLDEAIHVLAGERDS